MKFGMIPDVTHMRVFGCNAYVRVLDRKRSKLESKSKRCMLLGYADSRKAYRLWDAEGQRVINSIDVMFDEDTMFSTGDCAILQEREGPQQRPKEHKVERVAERKVGPGTIARQAADKPLPEPAQMAAAPVVAEYPLNPSVDASAVCLQPNVVTDALKPPDSNAPPPAPRRSARIAAKAPPPQLRQRPVRSTRGKLPQRFSGGGDM